MNVVQLYDYIKQIALTIPIVHSYSNQSPYDFWNTEEVKYGSVVFAVKGVKTQNNIAKYECVLYYGDRLNESGSNRDSIQSDAIGVLESIVSRLNCSERIEFVTYPIQSTLFEQKFADNLAGAYANLSIDLPTTGSCCDYNLLDDYYTKSQIDDKLENIESGGVDLSDYYTKEQVDEKIENIEVDDIDLSDYYNKEQVDNKIAGIAKPDWNASPVEEGYIENRTHYISGLIRSEIKNVTNTRAGETLIGGLWAGQILKIRNVAANGGETQYIYVNRGDRVTLPMTGPQVDAVIALVDGALALVQNKDSYGIDNVLYFEVYSYFKPLDDFYLGPNVAFKGDVNSQLNNYVTKDEFNETIGNINSVLERVLFEN